MSKVKRNDPCPCGSGQKYKRCCLAKDEELRRQDSNTASSNYEEDEDYKDYDDHDDYDDDEDLAEEREIDEFWETFESKDYKGKKALLMEKMESDEKWFLDKEEIIDDIVFDMLDLLYQQALKEKDYVGFNELLATFEKKCPEIYQESSIYYLQWQIEMAIIDENWAKVSDLVIKMAKVSDDHIDGFVTVLNWLEYRGKLSLLLEPIKIAWPKVRETMAILSQSADNFVESAVSYLIFDHIETYPENIDKEEILRKMSFYGDFRPDWLSDYISHVTGMADNKWSLDDFDLSTKKGKQKKANSKKIKNQSGRTNLYHLTLEFLGYLRREKGVSYTKGEMARAEIYDYLVKRSAGELNNKKDGSMIGRKKKSKKKKLKIENILCPDSATMDIFVGSSLEFLHFQYHGVATMLELIPDWLSFLQLRNLLDSELRQTTLDSLQQVKTNLLSILNTMANDPVLKEQIEESFKAW